MEFPRIGSLLLRENVQDGQASNNSSDSSHANDSRNCEYAIGPCLSPALTWGMRRLLDNLDGGPFASENDYFNALAVALSRHAQELPVSHHALLAPIPDPEEYTSHEKYLKAAGRWNDFVAIRNKLDHSRNRFSYCMAVDVLQEKVVPRLCNETTKEDGHNAGFPLMHPDLHVGNIFVDDSMNVTCIIDWSCTTTVPVAELFATPRKTTSPLTRWPNMRKSALKRPIGEQRATIWPWHAS